MKKNIAALLAGVMTVSVLLTGCMASKGLETEDLVITKYKDLEIAKVEKTEITDDSVNSEIRGILSDNAPMLPSADKAIEDGDSVDIDFVGKMKGKEFDGGSGKGYVLQVGSHTFIEGFEDSLLGRKTGETYDWNGRFPTEYTEELAGKDVTFTITVNSIVPTELTEEMVPILSETAKNADEYREEIRKQLEADAEDAYNQQLIAEAWEAVMENTTVNFYPQDKLDERKQSMLDQYVELAEQYGTTYEDLIASQGLTEEEFEEKIEESLKDTIAQGMATAAIAEKENITISDDEYAERAQKIADEYGYPSVEDLMVDISEEDLHSVILNLKVGEWLVEHSVQVEGK